MEKYGSMGALPIPPYSDKLKERLEKHDGSENPKYLRYIIADLTYKEAKGVNLIITKKEIQLFKDLIDPNEKAILAEHIAKATNVDAATKLQAESYLKMYQGIQKVANWAVNVIDVPEASENIKHEVAYHKQKQGGYVTFEFLEFILPIKKSYNIIESYAKQLMNDTKLSAKFHGVAGAMDFINNVYDALIEGLTTNNWDNFFEQAKEYGNEVVISTAIGMAAIAGFGVMAAAGDVIGAVGTAGATVLIGAGIAAWGKMWYDIGTKVTNTDWDNVYEGLMTNILKINESKDWFDGQTHDLINGFADALAQFDKWGEKNSLVELLKDYQEILDVKENSKENFKHIKQLYDANTKFMGTQEKDNLTNTTTEGDHILYGGWQG